MATLENLGPILCEYEKRSQQLELEAPAVRTDVSNPERVSRILAQLDDMFEETIKNAPNPLILERELKVFDQAVDLGSQWSSETCKACFDSLDVQAIVSALKNNIDSVHAGNTDAFLLALGSRALAHSSLAAMPGTLAGLGSLETPEHKERQRFERPQELQSASHLEPQAVESGEDLVPLVDEAFRALLDYKDANPGPLSLDRLIINPESYAQTVENMFFVSFLAKEGTISMRRTPLGVEIEPVAEPGPPRQRSQIVSSINYARWQELAQMYPGEPVIASRRDRDTFSVPEC